MGVVAIAPRTQGFSTPVKDWFDSPQKSLGKINEAWLRQSDTAANVDVHGSTQSISDLEAQFIARASRISMHLTSRVYSSIVRQIPHIFEDEECLDRKISPSIESYVEFLRTLLELKCDLPPSIGISNEGDIVATWSRQGVSSLSFIYRTKQKCYDWVYVNTGNEDEDEKDSAAGHSSRRYIASTIEPYLSRIDS